jgi:hypothetical protein
MTTQAFHDNQFHRALWFDPVSSDLKIHDPKRLAALAKSVHASLVHFAATKPLSGRTLYPSKYRTMEPFAGGRDLLAEMVSECHRRGVKVSAYFNCHWLAADAFKCTGEWRAVYPDGKPWTAWYGAGHCPCVNVDPYIEESVNICTELASSYDIDGIFLDGPAIPPHTCYCDYCRYKFRKRYGAELPLAADWESDVWHNFIQFRFQSMYDYMQALHTAVKNVRDIPLYKNGVPLSPIWANAMNMEMQADVNDITGGEHFVFYDNPINKPTWGAGAAARYFRAVARDKPAMVYLCYPHKTWDYYPIPGADMKQMIAQTAANGAWPNVTVDDYVTVNDPHGLGPIRDAFALIEKNQELFTAPSDATVALLWSQATADFYMRGRIVGSGGTHDIRVDHEKEYADDVLGFYDMLVESHTPFDIILDGDVRLERLCGYGCVILGNAACLTEAQVEAVAAYVQVGGNIIGVNEVSLYDGRGRQQAEFQLGKVLGVSAQNDGQERIFKTGIDYQTFSAVKPFTSGVKRQWIPAATTNLRVKALAGSSVIGRFMNQIAFRYAPLQGVSDSPSLVANRHGKGTSLYFAGNVGSLFKTYYVRDIGRIVANALRSFAPPAVSIECEHGAAVELVTRRRGDTRVLHFINWTSRIRRPITFVAPVRDVKVRVKVVFRPRSVKSIVSGKRYRFTFSRGQVAFTIAELGSYEVITIE